MLQVKEGIHVTWQVANMSPIHLCYVLRAAQQLQQNHDRKRATVYYQ